MFNISKGTKRKSPEPSVKTKRQPRVVAQRKWTNDEINRILDYMVDTVSTNHEIEKPTADAYYAKMIDNFKPSLQDVTSAKLKQKVAHLKRSYIAAINWRGQTGQGVLNEEGSDAVKAYMLKVCPQFDLLDEIYGHKANVNPPFVHDSGIKSLDEIQDEEVYGLDHGQNVESPGSPATSTESEASIIEAIKEKLQGSTPKNNREKKDALTVLQETQSQRTEMLAKKICVEEKRLENEATWKQQEFEQRANELKIMEKRIDTDREIKLLEIAKEERIAMFKIEQEVKLKLQIELEKLKHNHKNSI